MRLFVVGFFILFTSIAPKSNQESAWIRINQLGYTPTGIKVAIWCSKDKEIADRWKLLDAKSMQVVSEGPAGKPFGTYGPFLQTYRLDFSRFSKPGRYFLQVGSTRSPEFEIGKDVYKGAADFCLRYMRQQRTGFNPFLKDSCHTDDGYTLYGRKAGIPDSTYMDVVGGWHDASDYLQYSTTSANAIWHLLAAYRDFPNVFADFKQSNGLDGKNGIPDIMDEADWGLSWLLKMHPSKDWMFNQIADDRDHMGMRIPGQDSFYGKGNQRPVYFISGEPQQRGKFLNNTTGTSSTAAKFASAFALAHQLYKRNGLLQKKPGFNLFFQKALDAYGYALKKPGVTQTASVRSPYIYAEDNWVDDMELASVSLYSMLINSFAKKTIGGDYLSKSFQFARDEKITPWLGQDTAKHYQWYPFINLGHYELAKELEKQKTHLAPSLKKADSVTNYYKNGIKAVWDKARSNAFYRGIPFIWCSNNLTVSFAIQCYWYRRLSNDNSFTELEQANFDWLFGCNPWGTSMVYGLPADGDTPIDPHSAFTHLNNYPIDGGLIDGPVYTSIFKGLIGIKLYQPDEYASFQSELAVYHDDYGDYSTNEPTMDGTASLIYLLAAKENESGIPIKSGNASNFTWNKGAIIRGDSTKKTIALVFTGHEFGEGAESISKTLQNEKVKASFFLTGQFYSNPSFKNFVQQLRKAGHYLGAHSNDHLLYCDWNKRDSLLVTKDIFENDIRENYKAMAKAGIKAAEARYFLPPYEWYNDTVAAWTRKMGLQLVNNTPGTRSHADYTLPAAKNYQTSKAIYQSIFEFEKAQPSGLNGFLLLIHLGSGSQRTDKFYMHLETLIRSLKTKGYQFQRVDQVLAGS